MPSDGHKICPNGQEVLIHIDDLLSITSELGGSPLFSLSPCVCHTLMVESFTGTLVKGRDGWDNFVVTWHLVDRLYLLATA